MRLSYVRGLLAANLLATSLFCACAASSQKPAAGMAAPAARADLAAGMAAAPAPLDESVFARNPQGQLTEENLQKILASPIELALPSRVGVLPIVTAADWRGPGPDFAIPSATGVLVDTLKGAEPFTLVTEMMPIPSGALGMEALREVAARYKLRYLLLYRQTVHATLQKKGLAQPEEGEAPLPSGKLIYAYGYLEASMFDVKTGLLLFTVRVPVERYGATKKRYQSEKLTMLSRLAAEDAAPALAKEIRMTVDHYAHAVVVEDQRRLAQKEGATGNGLLAVEEEGSEEEKGVLSKTAP